MTDEMEIRNAVKKLAIPEMYTKFEQADLNVQIEIAVQLTRIANYLVGKR